MHRQRKLIIVIFFTAALAMLGVAVVEARGFRRGGDDIYNDIVACKDGVTINLGVDKDLDEAPSASIDAIVLAADNARIFGGPPITWTLDAGPRVIVDAQVGDPEDELAVNLPYSGSKILWWDADRKLVPGSRVVLVGVKVITGSRGRLDVADTFETTVGNCLTSDSPNTDASLVFEEGDSLESVIIPIAATPTPTPTSTPTKPAPTPTRLTSTSTTLTAASATPMPIAAMPPSVFTSSIFVPDDISGFSPDQVIVDINIGMKFVAHAPTVWLTSPSGHTSLLFEGQNGDNFGTRLEVYSHGLVQDLMPDFLLDDDSEFGFSSSSPPYVAAALRPAQPLGLFNGEDPHGQWTLTIYNSSTTQPGEFYGWAMEIETAKPAPQISFQYGSSPSAAYINAQDAEIDESAPTQGAATPELCHVDGDGNDDGTGKDQAVLLHWDLAAVPANSLVYSATLDLNVANPSTGPYFVYPLLRHWSDAGATWNNAQGDGGWQLPGAQGKKDRGLKPLAAIGALGTGAQRVPFNADGVAQVQEWIRHPERNFGLIIADAETTDGLDFACSEAAVAANRPRLTVRYVPRGGTHYLPDVRTVQP